MASIRPLNINVQKNLISSRFITNIVHCLECLILNSIDAEALNITATINLSNSTVGVVDDGHGVELCDFDFIAEWYF